MFGAAPQPMFGSSVVQSAPAPTSLTQPVAPAPTQADALMTGTMFQPGGKQLGRLGDNAHIMSQETQKKKDMFTNFSLIDDVANGCNEFKRNTLPGAYADGEGGAQQDQDKVGNFSGIADDNGELNPVVQANVQTAATGINYPVVGQGSSSSSSSSSSSAAATSHAAPQRQLSGGQRPTQSA